jgi:hypothetical protein
MVERGRAELITAQFFGAMQKNSTEQNDRGLAHSKTRSAVLRAGPAPEFLTMCLVAAPMGEVAARDQNAGFIRIHAVQPLIHADLR